MAVNHMNACHNNLRNSLQASLFVLEAQTGSGITGTGINLLRVIILLCVAISLYIIPTLIHVEKNNLSDLQKCQ